ncbi:MAG TPA: CvpA family protein [Bacillota bacterium]|nr:CvpA family protein [Bacillota bacterium]
MTLLDWIIAIALITLAFRGYRQGLVSQIFDLMGSIFAVIGAFYFFEKAGLFLSTLLHVSTNLANILGFILVAVVISVGFGYIGHQWRKYTKSSALSQVDGLTGAAFGVLKGIITMIFIFMVMIAFPWSTVQKPVRDSFLAQDVLQLTPLFYYLQERSLPANVPRLMISPEGLQLRRFNYKSLDGAQCIVCGGKVRFDGYRYRGVVSYPHFTCQRCGAVSDGCLTFEGYHQFYGRCPWQSESALECKVWPSPVGKEPKGVCPVCHRAGRNSLIGINPMNNFQLTIDND